MVCSSLVLDVRTLDSDREASHSRQTAEPWLAADRSSQGTKGGDATQSVLKRLGLALGSELRIISAQSTESLTILVALAAAFLG